MKSSEHREDNKPKLFSNFVMNALAVSCGLVLIVLATTWFLAIWEIVFKFPSITAPSPPVSGENRISSKTVALVCMIGVVVVFPIALYVRLGTLREPLLTPAEVMVDSHYLGGRSSLFHTYNHRETDEVIFEVTLIHSHSLESLRYEKMSIVDIGGLGYQAMERLQSSWEAHHRLLASGKGKLQRRVVHPPAFLRVRIGFSVQLLFHSSADNSTAFPLRHRRNDPHCPIVYLAEW